MNPRVAPPKKKQRCLLCSCLWVTPCFSILRCSGDGRRGGRGAPPARSVGGCWSAAAGDWERRQQLPPDAFWTWDSSSGVSDCFPNPSFCPFILKHSLVLHSTHTSHYTHITLHYTLLSFIQPTPHITLTTSRNTYTLHMHITDS